MIELKLLLLLLIANGAPILTRKMLGTRFDVPLDGGTRTSKGRRWLGPSKTLRGLIAAILATTILSVLLGFSWAFGALFGMLTMLGDLIASFIKRRMGLPSSSKASGLDQIPEALIPLIYSIYQLQLEWRSLWITLLAFWMAGILLSRLLYKIGIRRHPY